MNKKFMLFATLILLPGCFFSSEKSPAETPRYTYYIQADLDMPAITMIKEGVTKIIDDIVKQELGLAPDNDFTSFFPKQWQALSLYSLNGMREDAQDLLVSKLKEIRIPELKPQNVALEPNVEFFGANEDELVFIINDPDKKLSEYNAKLQMFANKLNDEYKSKHKADLYNVSKSEHFSYVPHVGIGRLRIVRIKELIKDRSKGDEIINRIRMRVREKTIELAKEVITPANNKVAFNKIVVFSPQTLDRSSFVRIPVDICT